MSLRWVAMAACLLALEARGQGAPGELGAVRAKLAAQRLAVGLIEGKRVSVLEALELVERLARYSTERVHVLEADLASLQRRLLTAERQEAAAREVTTYQLRRLGPRLQGLYRLMRRKPLAVLLSAQDFSGMIWRSRALAATFDSDLALLRTVQEAMRSQARAVVELGRLQRALGERVEALRGQATLAEGQRAALQDLVGTLQGEAEHARRLVQELEAADAELTRLLAEMAEGPATSGFGALRGKLPPPVRGLVEVGFGKVVNPRFNTVTVQKGLDIRAAAGAPVSAVAEGTVAYAGWLRGYGNLVILDHGGDFHTLLAHLATVSTAVGARVAAGTPVGTLGDTGSLKGAYLYFEIRRAGQAVDPAPWLLPE